MPGTVPQGGSRDGEDDEEAERLARAAAEEQSAQWEFRATMLAQQNERTHGNRQRSNSSRSGVGDVPPRIPSPIVRETDEKTGRVVEKAVASTQAIDADIQEAIRLHEEGELERSTMIFGRLADPNGANNPLSQVLYGLALRLVVRPVPPEFLQCGTWGLVRVNRVSWRSGKTISTVAPFKQCEEGGHFRQHSLDEKREPQSHDAA